LNAFALIVVETPIVIGAEYAALEQNADVLLFGHTHEAYYECMEPGNGKALHVMNPGSCGYGWQPSYGRIVLDKGVIQEIGCHKI
jgi:predicted phosphodiesterase